ncbi:MAG: hypothetical protein AAHH96_04565 [Candidatus Symbiodolus clandestinus]
MKLLEKISSENMLAPMDFNTLVFAFFIGLVFLWKTSMILMPVTVVTFYLFKFLFPKRPPFLLLSVIALSCLVGSILFDKTISPKSIINKFSRGNYSATLILREEGCKSLREHSFLKVPLREL